MDAQLLAGDTALVTGAASGIGRGIAAALAGEGARVVLADLEAERGEEVAASLRAQGADTHFVATDLSTREGPAVLCKLAIERLGALSILVHAASPRRSEADTVLAASDETWDAMLAVNLRAGFVLGREAARDMIARRIRGRMLFITSLHAETPRNLAHYSASKAGQTMVMKELAKALGPHGIRVNAVCPGYIVTPLAESIDDAQFMAAYAEMLPLRHLGKPRDVAGAFAFLASDDAAFITGETLVIDGGQLTY